MVGLVYVDIVTARHFHMLEPLESGGGGGGEVWPGELQWGGLSVLGHPPLARGCPQGELWGGDWMSRSSQGPGLLVAPCGGQALVGQ